MWSRPTPASTQPTPQQHLSSPGLAELLKHDRLGRLRVHRYATSWPRAVTGSVLVAWFTKLDIYVVHGLQSRRWLDVTGACPRMRGAGLRDSTYAALVVRGAADGLLAPGCCRPAGRQPLVIVRFGLVGMCGRVWCLAPGCREDADGEVAGGAQGIQGLFAVAEESGRRALVVVEPLGPVFGRRAAPAELPGELVDCVRNLEVRGLD